MFSGTDTSTRIAGAPAAETSELKNAHFTSDLRDGRGYASQRQDSLGTFTMISGTDTHTRIAGAPAAETLELENTQFISDSERQR
jgi:hypothetical protein